MSYRYTLRLLYYMLILIKMKENQEQRSVNERLKTISEEVLSKIRELQGVTEGSGIAFSQLDNVSQGYKTSNFLKVYIVSFLIYLKVYVFLKYLNNLYRIPVFSY